MKHNLRAGTVQFIFGNREKSGALKIFLTYFVLIALGFVTLYPIIYMIVNSFFSADDLVNPAVTWVPSYLCFENYRQAFETLDFGKSLMTSFIMTLVPVLFQTFSTALVGFGLARFEFPLKKLWLVLIVLTFLIPTQVMTIPRYSMYYSYGMLNTPFPSFLPALFGVGIRSTVFILIFYQFFCSYPIAFDEAAELDGAGKFTIFRKIALPCAEGAVVLTFLFSFVWYWNETTDANLFANNIKTLPLMLQNFAARYSALYDGGGIDSSGSVVNQLNEAISLAGTVLSILPSVIIYLVLQKRFVESIERSGVVG
ncbi:MAG: carbohydrate ABC transporter permease [Acutalibacteraceae bacterium]